MRGPRVRERGGPEVLECEGPEFRECGGPPKVKAHAPLTYGSAATFASRILIGHRNQARAGL